MLFMYIWCWKYTGCPFFGAGCLKFYTGLSYWYSPFGTSNAANGANFLSEIFDIRDANSSDKGWYRGCQFGYTDLHTIYLAKVGFNGIGNFLGYRFQQRFGF